MQVEYGKTDSYMIFTLDYVLVIDQLMKIVHLQANHKYMM